MTAGADTSHVVRRLYLLTLGREADPDGLANALRQIAEGGTALALAGQLLASAESGNWRAGRAAMAYRRFRDPLAEAVLAVAADSAIDIDDLIATAGLDAPIPLPSGRIEAAAAREALLAEAQARPQPPLWVHGWKAFSQADEDGILAEIFRRIGLSAGRFLEIGASDGLENITTHWLLAGWSGIWIEGDPGLVARAESKFAPFVSSGRVRPVQAFIDPASFPALLDSLSVPAPLDLLSVDIDGNDFAITRHCLERLAPRVLVVEYNPRFGPLVDWVMPLDAQHQWGGDDWYGASLAAYTRLAEAHDMVLVGCNMLGSNAFYVRRELARDRFGTRHDPGFHYEPARYQLLPAFATGHPVNRDRFKRFSPG